MDASEAPMPLAELLDRYVLLHELRDSTEETYRRICSTWQTWATANGSPDFTEDSVSRFLLEKQHEGRSCYYRQSCRKTLAAILRSAGFSGPVRRVRCTPIKVLSWTPAEVSRLIDAVPLAVRGIQRRLFWETLIEAAYYTGLNWCDLREIRREDVPESGILEWRRSKTGKQVIVYLPARLVSHVPTGLIWEWPYCGEVFRQQFKRIVTRAGLTGSFKRLRKTAGTLVEQQAPGSGHLYLGDERRTFELHYWSHDSPGPPVHPPDLPARLRIVG
jgi:integrase